MKNVRVITTVGMLLAVATVLGFFKVPITEFIELRFAFLPIACTGMLFGPAVGGIMGMLSDILGYIVRPTGPFFPGFTISAIAEGLIYGFILYRKDLSVKRIAMAQLADTILVGMLLNPLWLSILYGQGFIAVFAARIIKTAVMYPINLVLLITILKPAHKFGAELIRPAGAASK